MYTDTYTHTHIDMNTNSRQTKANWSTKMGKEYIYRTEKKAEGSLNPAPHPHISNVIKASIILSVVGSKYKLY